MINWLKSRLSPFRHSNYRRFFVVQTVSLVGTWSHDLARAWLVLEIFNKAGALGGILLATAVPSLFLILKTGVVVDQKDPRKLMIATKLALMTSCLFLAYLIEFGQIEYWHLVLFAVYEGFIASLDFPSYQALSARIIPKEDFQQAIALNSTNFHMGRALGPLVAGGLMTWHGPAVVFLFDGLSYGLLAFVLTKIYLLPKSEELAKPTRLSGKPFREGIHYLFTTPKMRYRLLQFFLSVSILFPLGVAVFRAFLRIKFDLDTEKFGMVFSAPAFGAMTGAVCLTALKPKNPMNILKFAVPLVFINYVTLTQISEFFYLIPMMALSGFCTFLIFSSTTMSLHLEVSDQFRGRMASFMGLGWLSIGPLMSFPIGWFSDFIGYESAIIGLTAFFVLGSVLLYLQHLRAKNPAS